MEKRGREEVEGDEESGQEFRERAWERGGEGKR
jgi:hypothetical protein